MILLEKNQVKTMTSYERVAGLHAAIQSIYKDNIVGDFVECGVYLGGNIIIGKKFFDSVGVIDKKYYAFDTFEGMTAPGENDPNRAHQTWQDVASCVGPLDEVIHEFKIHDVYDERIILVKGDVLQTLFDPKNLPERISLLRLDTDWYESTKCELETLYDRLVPGGYIIIDDYGHWAGCRKAVDEFFGEDFVKKNFISLDYTGIMYRKG